MHGGECARGWTTETPAHRNVEEKQIWSPEPTTEERERVCVCWTGLRTKNTSSLMLASVPPGCGPALVLVLVVDQLWSGSDGGLSGSFGPQSSGPAQEGEGGSEAAGSSAQAQTGPGATDGPAVAVVHVRREPVDEGGVPGEVVGHAGRIRAQRDGAEDP